MSRHGYVGLGEVTAEAVPFNDFIPDGENQPLPKLPLRTECQNERATDPERLFLCVGVRCIKPCERGEAVLKDRAYRGTLNKIRQPDLVAELLKTFDPDKTR